MRASSGQRVGVSLAGKLRLVAAEMKAKGEPGYRQRIALALSCWLLGQCLVLGGESLAERPAAWAQPLKVAGVPNLHLVSTNLYRSAQPSAEGMQNLKRRGIITVVNLRSFNSDRPELGSTGLGYEHIYMKTWHPEREEIVRFLQIVTDPKRAPVLVHCQHGADRTGTMCAVYRVAVQQWTKEEALREMTQGGFGFHGVWDNLVHWIEGLDIESIQKEAGIKPSPPPGAPRNPGPSPHAETNTIPRRLVSAAALPR